MGEFRHKNPPDIFFLLHTRPESQMNQCVRVYNIFVMRILSFFFFFSPDSVRVVLSVLVCWDCKTAFRKKKKKKKYIVILYS